jgi:hypothetical protein
MHLKTCFLLLSSQKNGISCISHCLLRRDVWGIIRDGETGGSLVSSILMDYINERYNGLVLLYIYEYIL